MKHTILCTVAALGLLTAPALAQNATRPAAGGAQTAPAGGAAQAPAGAEAPVGGGAEKRLPEGQPRQGAPAGAAHPAAGAENGKVSPGMESQPGAKPEAGQRQKGENTGVSPKGASGEPRQPETGGARQQTSGETQGRQGGANRPARAAPRLSGTQETRVRETFRTIDVRPVNINFNVAVGVAIPRTVELRPVPREIVTLVPDYEGFEFFVAPGRIIIVDPDTLEIVAILPL